MITEIYFVAAPEVSRFKIGRTVDVRSRLQTLRTSSPVKLECIATTHVPRGVNPDRFEKACHDTAAIRGFSRLHSEWFDGDLTVADCERIVASARVVLLT